MPSRLLKGAVLLAAMSACKAPVESSANAGGTSAPSAATSAAAQVATAEPGAPARASKLVATSPCVAICARSTELACTRAKECEATCAASMADGVCIPEVQAAATCMLREPSSNWECSDGPAAIKDGFCGAEQAKVANA